MKYVFRYRIFPKKLIKKYILNNKNMKFSRRIIARYYLEILDIFINPE